MYAHKALAELVLQRLQRLVEQHLARFVAQGDVFMVGDEIDDLRQRDQLDALAGAGTDMAARAATLIAGGPGQRRQLRAVGFFRAAQGVAQRLGLDGFVDMAQGALLEGLAAVFVVTGAEHHRRRCLALAQFGGHLQAIEAGHTDVQQHHIGLEALDQCQGLLAVGGAGLHHGVALQLAEQPAQAFAGLGFVINDQDIHNCAGFLSESRTGIA